MSKDINLACWTHEGDIVHDVADMRCRLSVSFRSVHHLDSNTRDFCEFALAVATFGEGLEIRIGSIVRWLPNEFCERDPTNSALD
jgi:hypothetical protein